MDGPLLASGYERTNIKQFLADVASVVKKNPLYVVLAAEVVSTENWKTKFFPVESEQTRADLKRSITYGVFLDMVAHLPLLGAMNSAFRKPSASTIRTPWRVPRPRQQSMSTLSGSGL